MFKLYNPFTGEELEVNHLPGKHGQKSHGKGKGGGKKGGGVRGADMEEDQLRDEMLRRGFHEDFVDEASLDTLIDLFDRGVTRKEPETSKPVTGIGSAGFKSPFPPLKLTKEQQKNLERQRKRDKQR